VEEIFAVALMAFTENRRRSIMAAALLKKALAVLSRSISMLTPIYRQILRITIVLAAGFAISAHGQDIKVSLLGTGTPAPVMNRFGPSILVEAGGQKFVFDAGRGALQRLNQLKVGWQDVQGVFLTHLHSDHVVGFPDLWLTGWLTSGRKVPLLVWGPRGTKKMMSHLEQAFEFDIAIRMADEGASAAGATIRAEDIAQGFVYENAGVKITVFDVDHAPIEPAFGYRIDYAGRSVVLSGDTRFSENLIRHAQAADLLIHEVISPETLRRAGVPAEQARVRVAHHSSPEQAGEVFVRTKPKLAVYSHIGPPSATEEDLFPATRKAYAGPLVLGEDLMVIDVGDKVTVRSSSKPSP
jgi:ribonuclease Z